MGVHHHPIQIIDQKLVHVLHQLRPSKLRYYDRVKYQLNQINASKSKKFDLVNSDFFKIFNQIKNHTENLQLTADDLKWQLSNCD